jgi:hypothetical protein
MQKFINVGIVLLVVSFAQIYGDAASIMADAKKLAADTAAQNSKNIQKYATNKKTAASNADKQKYYAALTKRIDQLRLSNADTAQKIEMVLLQVAGANVDIIKLEYLERPDGIKNDAKALAKKTAEDATGLRRKAGYKTQYTKDLKTRIAQAKSEPGAAPKIEALLLEDYYS